MSISIVFNFSKPLSDQVFVATGERRTYATFTFSAAELTPEDRAASLAARCYGSRGEILLTDPEQLPDYLSVSTVECRLDTAAVRCAEVCVDTEPSAVDAQRAISAQLAAAAAFGPAVPTLIGLRAEAHARLERACQAKRNAEHAMTRVGEIAVVVGWPVSRWIDAGALRERVQAPGGLPDDVDALRAIDPGIDSRVRVAEAALVRFAAERRDLIEACGTPSQRERFAAGVLPAEEYVELARSMLFAPFACCARYTQLTGADIAHEHECGEEHNFRAEDYAGALSESEFDARKQVRAVVDAVGSADACTVAGAITISTATRRHEAYCTDECGAEAARLSERVTIEFAGGKYTEDFAL